MIPGEIIAAPGDIELNAGQPTVTLTVANTGDRPGTAVRFEPGQSRDVTLVPLLGARKVYGFNQKVMGDLDGGAN